MALPPMRSIYSSHVDSVGYSAETQELYVTWDTGKTSVYSGVPPKLADEVTNSWSVGKALTAQVKSVFPHRYVE
jgi:hypothetical protein